MRYDAKQNGPFLVEQESYQRGEADLFNCERCIRMSERIES